MGWEAQGAVLYLGCGVGGTGCSAVLRVWGGRHRVQCCIEGVGWEAQGSVKYLNVMKMVNRTTVILHTFHVVFHIHQIHL